MLALSGGLIAAGIVINLIISAVVGLAPLFYGRSRGRFTLGIVAFAVTTLLGTFFSFLVGVVLAIVFLIAIWASSRSRRTTLAA